jgi:hypothetical protein
LSGSSFENKEIFAKGLIIFQRRGDTMPDNYQLQIYSIEGSMKLLPPYDESENSSETDDQVPITISPKENLLAYLNEHSSEMAQQINAGMRKMLPQYAHFTVETEISFFEGSLIIAGSVILAATWSFLQPILVESAKKALETAFETGLSQLIESAVKRVVSSWLPKFPKSMPGGMLPRLSEPMQVSAKLVKNISTGTVDNQPSQQTPPQQTPTQQTIPLYFRGLVLADTLLLLIIIIASLVPHIRLIP